MTAAVARTDARAMALCVRYLDIAPNDVVTALRDADGDTLVHTVFPAWNKLPTVLLKTAGEALGLGIVPLVAVAIGRPADQTERRLRAVPPTQKLSSVFAPELARRLLREKT